MASIDGGCEGSFCSCLIRRAHIFLVVISKSWETSDFLSFVVFMFIKKTFDLVAFICSSNF